MYENKRIKLRGYQKSDDMESIKNMINDPSVKNNITVGTPFPFTSTDQDKFYNSQTAFNSNGQYNFAIERKEDSVYLGGCGLNNVDFKNSVATIGIFLGKEFHGMGYGFESLETLINFIFEQMNINKVKLVVYSFNENAIKLYKKLNFSVEGTLRDEIFRNNQYHDIIHMGLLRKEWESNK